MLEIEEAAFASPRGRAGPHPSGRGSALGAPSVLSDAGGDAALKAARVRKRLGYIFGLEMDAQRLAPGRRDAAGGASLFWSEALTAAKREENCPALSELCAPELVVLEEPPPWPAASRPAGALVARAELVRFLRDTFGLAGVGPGSALDVEHAAYLDGLLSGALRDPASPASWPFFSAAFGHCVRVSCDAKDAVRFDDPAAVLVHLLAGEVPLYALQSRAA